MKIIIIGLIIWLIYDTYKNRKIERELQDVKQSLINHPTEKGGEAE